MADNKSGVIYILTNPSFPEYIKIGYATDLEKRLAQLNRSETIPFAFRAYAIYEVGKALTDKDLHNLIDQLNPDLRSIEEFDGKKRVKEFYTMSAEDAYHLLECIAKISGTIDRLHRVKPEGHEIEDEQVAEEVREIARRKPFAFSDCKIKSGEKIFFTEAPNMEVEVVDDKHIAYNGITYSLTGFCKEYMPEEKRVPSNAYQGPAYFTYKGVVLTDLREQLEKKKY